MNLQRDNVIVDRRPDIVIDNKVEKTAITLDVEKPGEKRIIDKEREKFAKYQNRDSRTLKPSENWRDTCCLTGSWECYKELREICR